MRLLDVKESGIVEHLAVVDGKMVIKKTQDIDAVLRENAIQRNNDTSGWKGDFHKVASIPMIMVEIWNKELKDKGCPNANCLAAENKTFFMGKLSDYNYSKLRTKTGKL